MLTDIKKRATHRSKIIQGQVKGLEKMIGGEEYCVDILTQSLAVQKSLRSLNKLILENHLETHVKDMFETENSKVKNKTIDDMLKELLDLYELSSVRS